MSVKKMTGLSIGSVIDHIGFSVPDVDATVKAPQAAGAPVPPPAAAAPAASPDDRIAAALKTLPAANTSASYIDLARNTELGDTGQSPIPAGSAGKLILAETVEQAIQQRRLDPSQQLTIQQSDVAPGNSSLAGQVGRTIAVRDLLPAALVNDDNTAANLLERALGGFNAVNQEARRLGLNQTNLTSPFGSAPAGQSGGNVTSSGTWTAPSTSARQRQSVARSTLRWLAISRSSGARSSRR